MAEGQDKTGNEFDLSQPLHLRNDSKKTQFQATTELKILLIYHDLKICESLASLLRIIGYDVVDISNVSEAKVVSKFWNFDILIVDQDIPDTDGLTIIEDIKKLHPDVDVISLCNIAESKNNKVFDTMVTDILIKKPVNPEELISTVEKIAREKKINDIQNIEARYNTLVNDISEGVFFIDLNGNFLEINRSGSNILGYDEPDDAISGTGIKEHFTVNSDFQLIQLKALNEGEVKYGPLSFRRLDGSYGWIEISLKTRIDSDGKTLGLDGIFSEIAFGVQYREALTRVNSLLEDLNEARAIEEVGNLTLNFLRDILRVDRGRFSLVDGKIVQPLIEERLKKHNLMNLGPTSRALLTGEVQIESRFENPSQINSLDIFGNDIIFCLSIPIKLKSNVIGVIDIGRTESFPFLEDEKKIALIVANIVANILERIISSKIGLKFELNLHDFR